MNVAPASYSPELHSCIMPTKGIKHYAALKGLTTLYTPQVGQGMYPFTLYITYLFLHLYFGVYRDFIVSVCT